MLTTELQDIFNQIENNVTTQIGDPELSRLSPYAGPIYIYIYIYIRPRQYSPLTSWDGPLLNVLLLQFYISVPHVKVIPRLQHPHLHHLDTNIYTHIYIEKNASYQPDITPPPKNPYRKEQIPILSISCMYQNLSFSLKKINVEIILLFFEYINIGLFPHTLLFKIQIEMPDAKDYIFPICRYFCEPKTFLHIYNQPLLYSIGYF